MDNIDLIILREINLEEIDSGSSSVSPIPICEKLRFDSQEFGDRLESLAESGHVKVVGLGGTYARGMTLPNGIHGVRLTVLGRRMLSERK